MIEQLYHLRSDETSPVILGTYATLDRLKNDLGMRLGGRALAFNSLRGPWTRVVDGIRHDYWAAAA